MYKRKVLVYSIGNVLGSLGDMEMICSRCVVHGIGDSVRAVVVWTLGLIFILGCLIFATIWQTVAKMQCLLLGHPKRERGFCVRCDSRASR